MRLGGGGHISCYAFLRSAFLALGAAFTAIPAFTALAAVTAIAVTRTALALAVATFRFGGSCGRLRDSGCLSAHQGLGRNGRQIGLLGADGSFGRAVLFLGTRCTLTALAAALTTFATLTARSTFAVAAFASFGTLGAFAPLGARFPRLTGFATFGALAPLSAVTLLAIAGAALRALGLHGFRRRGGSARLGTRGLGFRFGTLARAFATAAVTTAAAAATATTALATADRKSVV